MKNNPTLTSQGFTLIETLFAILIFSAALLSLMVIASRGISATNQVKNETTAYYLAQEGLEVVRNIRDSNFVVATAQSTTPWSVNFADAGTVDCTGTSGCYVTYNQAFPPALAPISGNAAEIKLDSNGTYGNTGTSTGFNRVIRVIPQNQNGGTIEEYLIESQVSWQAKTILRSVTLQTILKKWQ